MLCPCGLFAGASPQPLGPSPQVVSRASPKSATRQADTEEPGGGPGREVAKGSSFPLQLLVQTNLDHPHPISTFTD